MPVATSTSFDPKLLKYQEKQARKAQKSQYKEERYLAKHHPYMSGGEKEELD